MNTNRTAVILLFMLIGCANAPEKVKSKSNGDSAEQLYRKGTQLLEKDPARAIEFLTKSLEANPDAPPALYNRAVAFASVGRDTEAVADLERLEKVAPETARPLRAHFKASAGGFVSIAEHELKAKNYEAAIKKCDTALVYNPQWGDAWVVKGVIYKEQGDPKKALECYDKGAQVDPTNPFVYFNRALLHEKEKRHEQALADFTKCIDLDPADPDAFAGRARVYSALEMPLQAKADETRAKELTEKRKKDKAK